MGQDTRARSPAMVNENKGAQMAPVLSDRESGAEGPWGQCGPAHPTTPLSTLHRVRLTTLPCGLSCPGLSQIGASPQYCHTASPLCLLCVAPKPQSWSVPSSFVPFPTQPPPCTQAVFLKPQSDCTALLLKTLQWVPWPSE